MKTVFKLSFGVIRRKNDIEYGHVRYKIIASTSHMASFIREFERYTGTELIYKEEEILKPYYHQKIMDI